MQAFAISRLTGSSRAAAKLARRLRGDQQGTTAIEFGMVAFPFLLFVFGILVVGLQFFTINALDHAVESVSRKIRTGQAQKEGWDVDQFKAKVCAEATGFLPIECGNLMVHIQSGGAWADITPTPCASGGNLTPQSGSGSDPLSDKSGVASAVVLVTACYDWTLPADIYFLQLMLMKPADGVALASGGSLIQAVATFRTEPYQ
jgi:hypothetical protein